MPYVWDEGEAQYVWKPFAGAPVSAFEQGIFAPDPTRAQEYRLAARGALGGGFTDRPGASQYLAGAQDPLYGQYLMDWGSGVSDPSRVAAATVQSFQDWLRGPTPTGDATRESRFRTFNPSGAVVGGGPFSQFDAAVGAPATGAESWADIINLARAMRGTADVSGMAGYDRWGGVLANDERAMALANMASYREPGSIGGGRLGQELYRRGINRRYEDWAAPLADQATGANWLAYITGQDAPAGMVRSEFRV